MDTSNGKE
jgi:hypothetical protein